MQPDLPWFHVASIEPGVTLVAEPGHVFSWLVSGRDGHLLIDTGLGVADIRAAIDDVVGHESLQVVNSHAHFDHVGGNHLFERRAIHHLGVPRLAQLADPAAPFEYHVLDVGSELVVAYARSVHESWKSLLAVDRTGPFVLGPEEEVRPWPPSGLAIPVPPPQPTDVIEDGFVFDLGNRRLRVIHTPGHAAEHVCLLDERSGILFAQDQAYYGPHYVCFEGSDLVEWAASAAQLAEVSETIRIVYTGHNLRYAVPPRFLRELAVAGQRVLAGDIELGPALSFDGGPALSADFGHFSIVLPASFGSEG